MATEIKRDDLAKYLRMARKKRKVTQLAIAEELGYTTAQFISNWERGISEPPLDKVQTLAKFLQIGRNSLLEAIFSQRAKVLAAEKAMAFEKYGVKK